jgi:phosphate transport system permease protein
VGDFRGNVARRKRADLAFAVVGALLIAGSLGVLGVLIADLIRDGAPRLAAITELREDGQIPTRRDVVGQLTRAPGPDGQPEWRLNREPMALAIPEKLAADAAGQAGRRVILTGVLPAPGEAMEVEKVVALPGEGQKAPRLGRRDIVGVLEPADAGQAAPAAAKPATAPAAGASATGTSAAGGAAGAWRLRPDPVTLDVSSLAPDKLAKLENATVAASGAKVVGGAGAAGSTMAVDDLQRMVSKTFFTSMPSSRADRAGIHSAWVGTILVMLVTVFTALPIGIGAGTYLEEYAPKNRLTALIEINIANLAGVPSIVWGLMALGLFIYQAGTGRSVLTAGLTLGLLVLPIVIIATREAIRAVPGIIREASYALGSTKWETVRHHVLPYSMGGILTGVIVSLSRAIGETAPLITIGALTYVAFLPESPVKSSPPFVDFSWLQAPFTVLPIQMFNWVSRPDRAFHDNAAAAGIVLITMTLGMNAVAIALRYRLRKRISW